MLLELSGWPSKYIVVCPLSIGNNSLFLNIGPLVFSSILEDKIWVKELPEIK